MSRTLPYREEAMNFIELAKRNLQRDGYLVPIVATTYDDAPGDIYIPKFGSYDEKRAVYSSIWSIVIPKNPRYIFILNDAYAQLRPDLDNIRDGSLAERYRNGDKSVKEVISMFVLPRGEAAWQVSVFYDRRGKEIEFGEPNFTENETGRDIAGGLVPEPWKGDSIGHTTAAN